MALACSAHSAFIYDRGGVNRVGQIGPLQRVKWTRQRDSITDGLVEALGVGKDCGELLSKVRSGRHELVIFRGNERCWEGPITWLEYQAGRVSIQAKDVFHYWNRTAMHAAYDNAHPRIVYATVRVERAARAELARKEALGYNLLTYLDVRSTDGNNAKTSRSTKKMQMLLWEDLDELAAKGGIDYVAVGRTQLVFDTNEVIGKMRTLTDDDFLGNLIVTEYGMELATRSIVTDGEGRWGAAGMGDDDYYGEIELLHTVYQQGDSAAINEVVTTAEMTSQAARNMSGRMPAPVVIRVPDNTTLAPETVGQIFPLLVPGVRIPVTSSQTLRRVQQEQKLDKVVFEETASGGETVKVTMSPAPGVTPWEEDGSTSADGEGEDQ